MFVVAVGLDRPAFIVVLQLALRGDPHRLRQQQLGFLVALLGEHPQLVSRLQSRLHPDQARALQRVQGVPGDPVVPVCGAQHPPELIGGSPLEDPQSPNLAVSLGYAWLWGGNAKVPS
ncbi:hypothetical protein ACE1SV_73960 [Streptomyces sp. E-15]